MTLRDVVAAAAATRKAAKPKAEGDPPEDDDEDEPAAEGDEPKDEEEEEEEPAATSKGGKKGAKAKPAAKPVAAVSRSALATARAEARTAERERISAILSAPEAEANPTLAAHLALETDTPAAGALGVLKAAGPSDKQATGLAGKMAEQGNPKLGTGAADQGGKTADERLVSFAKAAAEAKRKKRA